MGEVKGQVPAVPGGAGIQEIGKILEDARLDRVIRTVLLYFSLQNCRYFVTSHYWTGIAGNDTFLGPCPLLIGFPQGIVHHLNVIKHISHFCSRLEVELSFEGRVSKCSVAGL